MAGVNLQSGETLLVASRGTGPEHGLYSWMQRDGAWVGTQHATVRQLSALARHPTLPVVYGTSGMALEGMIHAWRVAGDAVAALGEKSSEGAEPCHLVVDPSGRLLIVTNYTTSTLGLQRLAADGSFEGDIALLKLNGGGVDPVRQDDAHPHQAFFHEGVLFVIDLGADLVREYRVDPERAGAEALVEMRTTAVPSGTGPRHAVVLPDGRLAISGELGSNLVVGRPGDAPEAWANVPSTTRTGPAKTRHVRNYPGDIQRSVDGRHVYFANRSHDTIATFDVSGPVPVLVSERDATVHWPQHLMVHEGHLLIAGWDSSQVVAMTLADGVPGPAGAVFACGGAGWLFIERAE